MAIAYAVVAVVAVVAVAMLPAQATVNARLGRAARRSGRRRSREWCRQPPSRSSRLP